MKNYKQQFVQIYIIMQDEMICVKIKDGLYIANKIPAYDIEFLLTNKFGFVLNCTNQLKNEFEEVSDIKYCKLKYDKNKPKLWGEGFKKLEKIIKFINESEEQAECCLVHSENGDNRACAVIIAYLMKKFYWTYKKSNQFLESKKVQIKLSEEHIKQLKCLEGYLQYQAPLSNEWNKIYHSEQERIVTNTYLNTLDIKYIQSNKKKKDRPVIWDDKIIRSKNVKTSEKQQLIKPKSMKLKSETNLKMTDKSEEISRKVSTKKKREVLPKSISDSRKDKFPIEESIDNIVKQVIKLQKKKRKEQNNIISDDQQDNTRPIYNVTVNNYINPNINIYTKQREISQKRIRPTSTHSDHRNFKKELDKNYYTIQTPEESNSKLIRTYSQKQQKFKASSISQSLMKSLMQKHTIKEQKRQKSPQIKMRPQVNNNEKQSPKKIQQQINSKKLQKQTIEIDLIK